MDDLAQAFADKLPKTHGAPVRHLAQVHESG
jgi:hypothetical protein